MTGLFLGIALVALVFDILLTGLLVVGWQVLVGFAKDNKRLKDELERIERDRLKIAERQKKDRGWSTSVEF